MAEEALFSDELDEWLNGDGPKPVGALNDVFDERSFAVAIALLMFLRRSRSPPVASRTCSR
jgi:hypothetical protein